MRKDFQEKVENLEAKVQEKNQSKVVDGLKAVPPILACTAGVYLLGMTNCVKEVSQTLPIGGLNLGYHLAAGSGLYGGYTSNRNRKVTSLVTLAAAFTPEFMMMAHDGDMKNIGVASAAKLIGYGLGYIVGYIVK